MGGAQEGRARAPRAKTMNELRVAREVADLRGGVPGARELWTPLDIDDDLEFLTRRFGSALGPLVVNVVTALHPARELTSVNAYFESTGWCLDVDLSRGPRDPRHLLMRFDRGSMRRIGAWDGREVPPGMGTRQWELAIVLRMALSAALSVPMLGL